jgi:drug/metabolite transporter (DMT)-like permease
VGDARLFIAALLLVESLYYIFARLLFALLPPAAGAMYMMALGTLEIAVLLRGRIDWSVLSRHRWLFLALGGLVGVNTNMGFVAMRYVDPGTASVLSLTSIVFGVGLGLVWLGERLSRAEWLGAAIATAGVVTITAAPGDYLRWGSAIVIAATFLYALHAAVAKRYSAHIPFGEFMLFRTGAVAAVLVVLALAQGQLVWPSPPVWGWLLVAATVNVVIGRALYYVVLRRIDVSLLTIILTLTPVVTWLWSMALFGGRPGRFEIAGGAATLAGVLIVTSSRAGLLSPGPSRRRAR